LAVLCRLLSPLPHHHTADTHIRSGLLSLSIFLPGDSQVEECQGGTKKKNGRGRKGDLYSERFFIFMNLIPLDVCDD
jgi:hypothetical protein